ncbi:DUF6701 domain-containing protein [Aeromonas sp. MR16]|uniref:DUF6701 domain-containing protein n=1 Tax=Aeromonas sp. MR16 TaxID=2923420 RepID=UPI001F4B6A8A|nr:DUF6701 domain-containing protein [Aeromonas sp. MR16]MCH7370976.1 MSHA biogenesis protein MshQ [Aeromonas sp. MR16]
MKSRHRIWGSALWLLLGSASVQAANQCTEAFVYPVQSHASPGMLSMNGQSSITSTTVGTNYPFLGKNIQPNASCNNGGGYNGGTYVSNCNVSGSLASPIKSQAFISDPNDFPVNPGGFPSYSGQSDLACSNAISPAAGDYRNAVWSNGSCVATLKAGQTYRFDSLSLSAGAVLNLNGATVYAKTVLVNGTSDGIKGSGSLHASSLTVTDNGKLSGANVTVYNSLDLSPNSVGNVTSTFQPHYIDNVKVTKGGQMVMAAGRWSIKNINLSTYNTNTPAMLLQGQSSLNVYALTMSAAGISAAGNRSDLAVTLYQTLDMNNDSIISGYLLGHYVKSFKFLGNAANNLYFSGGAHWLGTLELGSNNGLVFDSGNVAQLYLNSALSLSDQKMVNANGKANNLMIYGFGKVTMSGNAKLNAILYVTAGDLDMSAQAQLTGAVSAVNVTMTGNSKIIHEPFGGDWPGMCSPPGCKDIFTDPPSEGVSMTPPPGVLVPPLGDLVCSKQGNGTSCTGHSGNSFVPGDHDFNNGSISNKAEIIATGVTARLYFNNLDLNNAELNPNNLPENLFIYVKGDLKIAGQNKINAVVYVAGNVKMTGNASIEGALAAGGNIDSGGNSDFDFSQDAVDNVDLGGITCGGGSGGSQLDHFELTHSGQALTCNPETVVIKACANAGCSQLVTEQVSATLSLTPSSGSNGWVGGNQVVFSGGSTSAQLRNNTASAVTIGVSSSTPGFLHGTLCRAGSGALSAAACTLNFADSGFLFDVPDTLANKPQDVVISAVKKDTATQQCIPGFIGARSVGFWGTYTDPSTNIFNSKITIDGNAIPTYAASVTSPAATTINLTFDSQGKATLKKVSYPDAGQMRLNARHDGSGDTAGLVMTGSDLFVSRPVGLCITPTQGACAAGNISCPVFKKAGDDFQLNIGAVAWQADNDTDLCSGNLATPNFTLANIALGSQLVAPKPGVEAVVSKPSYDHAIAASNNLNAVTQSLNEVGVFQMTATPPVATSASTGYFGYTIPAATSVPVGRFVPWDFNLMSGTVTPACGGFSYMSQPFGVQTTVQARNKQSGITQNYRDAFAKGVISLVAANNKDGVDRSNRLDPLTKNWVSGQTSFDGQNRFVRLRELTPALTAPEEPLRLLRLGLKVTDGEATAVSFLTGRDMNPGVTGDCQSGVNCTARQLPIPLGSSNTMIAYYGRLLASTRQGVASAPLALPLQVQYFEGGQWRVNQQDVCTQVSLAGGGILFTDPDQHYDAGTGDLTLKDGTRIRLGLGQVAPGGSQTRFGAGETGFHFAQPNQTVRIPYRILLANQPSQPTWLADPAMTDHLMGEAIFGRDRGNDRIIYRREVMP